ncbi:MAG: extracellular solute-binding protein [Lachnospiraceae bacterium]|nr:extracellular solute-binding protein [Lachnospiraceae bacterium]
MKKRLLATVLSVAMLTATIMGCSSGSAENQNETTVAEENAVGEEVSDNASDDIVRLQILNMPSNDSGIVDGWFLDYLKERSGVELEFLPTGDQGEQKLQALMASGELPDLVVFKDDKQIINAVIGDMLLAYDDYKDLLPNVYNNAEISLKYYADNASNGQGKAYAVGEELQNTVVESADMGAPFIRYDYYKEIGSPEIKTMEDYLTVLKQMQDAHPTNEDGKKVYAFSIWKDWDRSYMTLGMFFAPYVGHNIANEGCLAEVDYTNNENVISILDPDSAYVRFLNFMYQANQMGLLDPDSMTQRFNDATQKTQEGRVLFAFDPWGTSLTAEQENQGMGFRRVAATQEKYAIGSKQEIGKGWSISVSKNCKDPEAAMRLINVLYDYETAMTEQNGPRGICWDLDENGVPYMTELGYQLYTDPEKVMGKEKGNATGIRAFSYQSVNKDLNCLLNYTNWERPDYAPAESKLITDWKEDFGFKNVLEYQYSLDNVVVRSFVPTPTLTDEMEQISSRVGDVVKTNSWKMIFAKDQAEFDSLYQEMVEKAEGMGINDFVDWFRVEYEKGVEFGEKYTD